VAERGDTEEEQGSDLSAPGLAQAAPTLDGLERDRAKASLRAKMFGKKADEVRIGRFVVLKRLGAGGMGVVYLAYDGELDRKLAIKLLRPDMGDAGRGSKRLMREARALAKLSHPNVVQIYEVGTHEDQVYVAMEFIEGQTLGEWMQHEPKRKVEEIASMFIAAGQGLAAAHAAGLVHRDFKPANVLVGNDGQVRVLDFGLAQPVNAEGIGVPSGQIKEGDQEITRGGIAGTPAYMAPEQYLAEDVDARTDQFSFCVALFEAFYGQRPFSGESILQLTLAVTEGDLKLPPRSRDVPERFRKILFRGLSTDPANRYPDMQTLLVDLSFNPGARKRRILAGTGFVLAIAASVAGTYVWSDSALDVCGGGEERLAGIWDADRRKALETAFEATRSPLAPDTWTRVEALLDAYSENWVQHHLDACTATQAGEQSQELLDLRMRCLDQRLRGLDALVDVLADADASIVESATEAATQLPLLERCADLEALAAEVKPPDDPKVAAAVDQIHITLAQSTAREDGGQYKDAQALAAQAVEGAEPLDYSPVLAEALLRRGRVEVELGDYEPAEKSLSEAFWKATESDHDRVAASAASTLVYVSERLAQYDEGHSWARHADSIIKKMRDGRAEEAHLLENVGHLLDRESKYDEARKKLEKALSIRNEVLGPEHPVIASSLHRLGTVVYRQGEVEQARKYFKRALDIQEAALGTDHPKLGAALRGIGITLKKEGRYADARPFLERAIQIAETAFGPEHAQVADELNNLGNVLRLQGEFEEARRIQQRALAIRRKAFGDEHPLVAQSLGNLGLVDLLLDQFEISREHQLQALQILEKRFGSNHSKVANTLNNLGEIDLWQGKPKDALQRHQQAHETRAQFLDDDHPEVAYGLSQLARAEVALGLHAEAKQHAERSLQILEKPAQVRPELKAEARFALARALWVDASREERALSLARQAGEGFKEAGAQCWRESKQVEEWLAEHG
jgi:tetratricopeptide (TPR) repeat protein/predicted Ser/Thr protein kinase